MYNIHEAKTHFSRLVERASRGEVIIIGRAGTPVARLVPFKQRSGPRRPGAWKGKVKLAPDFDELPADVLASFEGDED